ncbi:MAG: hypothetical protein AAFU79_03020 [Myxococcota bacterium]
MKISISPSHALARGLSGLTLSFAAAALASSSSTTARAAPPSSPAPESKVSVAEAPIPPRILSAYYGLDKLPLPVLRLCPLKRSVGADGMPVTFSVQLDPDTVKPEAFAVTTSTGEVVKPKCATLRPADEQLENRTVLLAGTFGTIDAQPTAVEIVGDLRGAQGQPLRGLRSKRVTPLEDGPSLLLAERFAPDTPGLAGECPTGTQHVVQLTWEGGVTGPEGADLKEPQRTAVEVTLGDGSTLTPTALADDDPDNFVHACLATSVEAVSVAVKAGYFHDPRDDANPDTRIEIVPGKK